MTKRITIFLCGPLRVIRNADGTDLTPKSAKVRGLVVLLALTPGLRQGRAWIQDKLWSESGPEQGQASLRQALTELRKSLGPDRDVLETKDGWAGFRPDAVEIDLAPPAASHGVPGTLLPELASGLEITDPEFEDWLRDQRIAFGDPVVPEPPKQVAVTKPPGQKRPARNELPRALRIALVAAALVLGVAVYAVAQYGRQVSLAAPQIPEDAPPSVAVMPFRALDADERQTAFVDGASEDLVTDLSKFSSLFVIASHSSFRYDPEASTPHQVGADLGVRYVLSGTIQWLGDTVRVNARLMETETARNVWSDRFDRPVDDFLALQNDIVRQIVGVIGPGADSLSGIRNAELKRLERLPTRDLKAYDHYLYGLVRYEEFTEEGRIAAREAFRKARTLDPGYARAYARETWTHLSDYWGGRTETPDATLAKAEELAISALKADPTEARAHWALASVLLFQKRHSEAMTSYQRAIELNPNDADLHMHYAWAKIMAGEPEGALPSLEKAMDHNPFYPGWYLWDLGLAHFVARDYDASIDVLEARTPKTTGTYRLLAQSYAMAGQDAKARDAMQNVMASTPHFAVEVAKATEPYGREADLAHHLEALRRAGFPETVQVAR